MNLNINDKEEQLLQKNITDLCRTCMASDSNFTSLFSVFSLSNKEEALSSILYKCTSIQVNNSDVLPQSICNSCLEKLAICYLYRELCFDTQSRLQQLYDFKKQQLPYTNRNTEEISCINSINPSNNRGAKADYISYRTTKTEYTHATLNIDKNVDTPLPNPKTIEQDFKPNENLEQSCDFEYLDCDNPNSCDESDGEKEYNLEVENLGLSCIICSKTCISKYSLNRHVKSHSDIEELKCHICMKKFTRAADVKRHLSRHTGEKPHVCYICKCSFTQSGSLAAHIRQKHKDEDRKQPPQYTDNAVMEKPHLCPTCGRCFRHSSTLKMHLRRHVGDKPYECKICKLRFVSSARLKSHIRVHTGERPFVCHICNKSFAQITVLSRHLKAHDDIKPHMCSYCPKRFFSPYYLSIHIRKHTGEKPLKCSTCDKSFACPKTLKQHEKIHSNEKPYLCMNCGKSFRRTQHLKAHMKLHGKD